MTNLTIEQEVFEALNPDSAIKLKTGLRECIKAIKRLQLVPKLCIFYKYPTPTDKLNEIIEISKAKQIPILTIESKEFLVTIKNKEDNKKKYSAICGLLFDAKPNLMTAINNLKKQQYGI